MLAMRVYYFIDNKDYGGRHRRFSEGDRVHLSNTSLQLLVSIQTIRTAHTCLLHQISWRPLRSITHLV